MAIFTKESLDTLRQKIDLIEVISAHVDLKRAGAAYKALCPFHDEKSPSFMIQKGDSHYHCFGCGAHGDAIQFLMNYLKMGFSEAVASLAEKFHVHLDQVDGPTERTGPSRAVLKEALETACRFYNFYLLHTEEGHTALRYLYERGLDLEFINQFRLGLAPHTAGIFKKVMREKNISDEILQATGLITQLDDSGRQREFFSQRILFPIHEASGAVIGFSGRKYQESTFGGKYVNTPETPLFKKSRILFGLNYSRKRIAKEGRAIVVEGQIDALRLIHAGFNMTVAGQGTAFGEGHVQELLNLGVKLVFLAMDPDGAGQEAASKIGNLFQKQGVEVRVVGLPIGLDPDAYIKEKGPEGFQKLLEESQEYLPFLVDHCARKINRHTPAGKNELVNVISKQIREWNSPLMVHESLRKMGHLLQVPEHLLAVEQAYLPNVHIRKSGNIGNETVNPDRILECDFLRWLLLKGGGEEKYVQFAKANLAPNELRFVPCRNIYQTYITRFDRKESRDLLSLIDTEEEQLIIKEILGKKVNLKKSDQGFCEAVNKILVRNWMEQREEVRGRIQGGQCTDDELTVFIKQFDVLKNSPPELKNLQLLKQEK